MHISSVWGDLGRVLWEVLSWPRVLEFADIVMN